MSRFISENNTKVIYAYDPVAMEAFAVEGDISTGGINVNATVTPPALQDVNLTEVGGSAIALGQGLMAASLPVAIASNQSNLPVAIQTGTNIMGRVALDGVNAALKDDTQYGEGVTTGIASVALRLRTASAVYDRATGFDLTNSTPIATAIVDGSGDQITSFGGGVQYTDGDTDATPTGTLSMHWNSLSGDVLAASEANPFPVYLPDPTVNAQQSGAWTFSGTNADDSASVADPIMVGGSSVQTDGTDPGQVSAENDTARARTDMQRLLIVNQTHPFNWNLSSDYASAQTNTSLKAAPGAGLKLYITDITISNGATAGNITLLDGSGGTVKFEVYVAINGGAVANLRTPIVLTANTALCLTSTSVTTHAVNISGYTAP